MEVDLVEVEEEAGLAGAPAPPGPGGQHVQVHSHEQGGAADTQ